MPVSLEHLAIAINSFRNGSLRNLRGPGSESHTRALGFHVTLLFEKANNGIRRIVIELSAVGLLESAHVSGEFNRRHLHSETEPEVRYFVFPGETGGADFPLDAPFTESARDKHASDIFEMPIDTIQE